MNSIVKIKLPQTNFELCVTEGGGIAGNKKLKNHLQVLKINGPLNDVAIIGTINQEIIECATERGRGG